MPFKNTYKKLKSRHPSKHTAWNWGKWNAELLHKAAYIRVAFQCEMLEQPTSYPMMLTSPRQV